MIACLCVCVCVDQWIDERQPANSLLFIFYNCIDDNCDDEGGKIVSAANDCMP